MNRIFAADGTARRRGLFLFAALILLAVPQAAILPLIDRDEPRFAEASREMLQSGNFVVPMFNGVPRYAKPPLIYWAQAACFQIGGESAFTARLPSLLATAGTALLLYIWGFELAGLTSAGLIAALAYALCLQTMQQGRVATADALLIFFITLTGYAGWKLLALARAGKFAGAAWHGWGAILALGFAGGFLAKGPEALLPLLPLLFAARRAGPAILAALGAIFLLGLLGVAAWAVPAFGQTHGDYWREGLGHDVGDRMVSGFQGHGANSFGWYLLGLPVYVLLFWVSALPWSPLLVTARQALFRGWKRDGTDVYLLGNAALFFAVFTFMVTKLPHYTLPAFPFLALLLGRRWCAAGRNAEGPVRTMVTVGLAFTLFAWVALPLFLAVVPGSSPSPAGILVREAGALLRPETKFATVDFNEPTVIWEMRRATRAFGVTLPTSGVDAFLRGPGPRAVVLRTRTWQELGLRDPTWLTFTARGWNAARLAGVELTLVVKRSRRRSPMIRGEEPKDQRPGRRRSSSYRRETGSEVLRLRLTASASRALRLLSMTFFFVAAVYDRRRRAKACAYASAAMDRRSRGRALGAPALTPRARPRQHGRLQLRGQPGRGPRFFLQLVPLRAEGGQFVPLVVAAQAGEKFGA